MDITRLRGNKRRVYEILKLNENGQKILNTIAGDHNLIVNYGSTKTFIDNKDELRKLLGVLMDGTFYILQFLSAIKDHNLVQNDYIKVITDASTVSAKISRAIADFFKVEKIDENAISNFITSLDKASDIDTTGNAFNNIVGVSVYKQIYTMMYNFVLDCNGINKRAKLKAKGGYTASTNIHSEEYEVIMPENIKTGGKKKQLLKWISSRWNWTLPICCFDKIIHCYSGYFEILNNVHKYLPTIKYLSGVLKCSAESLLNCYDVGYNNDNVILRTSKQIKNDGTGLYLSVRPTNRTYNFHNLRVKGENSEQKSWYKLFINDKLMGMDTAEATYNKDIKASSKMQTFDQYGGGMSIEDNKEEKQNPNTQNQNPNTQNQNQNILNQAQIDANDFNNFAKGFIEAHGGDFGDYGQEYLMNEYLKTKKVNS